MRDELNCLSTADNWQEASNEGFSCNPAFTEGAWSRSPLSSLQSPLEKVIHISTFITLTFLFRRARDVSVFQRRLKKRTAVYYAASEIVCEISLRFVPTLRIITLEMASSLSRTKAATSPTSPHGRGAR